MTSCGLIDVLSSVEGLLGWIILHRVRRNHWKWSLACQPQGSINTFWRDSKNSFEIVQVAYSLTFFGWFWNDGFQNVPYVFCIFKMYNTGWAKSRRALVCFFIFMAEILGGYWQILQPSGKKIILLSPLVATHCLLTTGLPHGKSLS